MRIIIIILLAGMLLAYDLLCPDRSQRQLRSQGLCAGNSTFTCLEDNNTHTFNESCSEKENSVRPGRKFVYKLITTDIECSMHRYQPIKFYKTSAAVCLYLKSSCNEVGQIVARNGSSLTDNTCICDFTEGYAYVTRPADVCSCVPSREDCSCYEQMCPKDHILSEDNKCIYRNTPNVRVCATDYKSGKDATTTLRTDFTDIPSVQRIQSEWNIIRRYIVFTVVPVLVIITVIIAFRLKICIANVAMVEEEENFTRIFILYRDVTPKAVRDKFDHYFPSDSLTTILKQECLKLNALPLTRKQMALLFPLSGVTSSSSYDVTLMICLLQNLTTIPPPVNGFDVLPPNTEIYDGADLARVKYYRNKIFFSGKHRLPTAEFTTVWNDLEQALVRLGGSNVKTICDDIKQATLSHDTLLEVRQYMSTFPDENKSTRDQLSSDMDTLTKSKVVDKTTVIIEKSRCHDCHEQLIKEWEQEDKFFAKTHVVDVILEKLQTNHCITVTGKPGMGKSAIIHHIALLLHRNDGYTIVPCTKPWQFSEHFKEDELQVFVFDDVCGTFTVSQNEVGEWKKEEQNINSTLSGKKTKILFSTRLHVLKEKLFPDLNIFKKCIIDLTSDEHLLTMQEKYAVAVSYLGMEAVDGCKDILEKSEFLPLACFLCKQNSTCNVRDFLSNPFDIYTKELNSMEKESDTKWCALFLCILHNGKIAASYFEQEHDNMRQELQKILDHCSVNKGTSIMHVKDQLESLVGTYVKKAEPAVKHDKRDKLYYKIIHDKMFDFFCHYFGSKHQKIFIKYAEASVLAERTQLESLNEDHDEFTVIIKIEHEDEYFQRSSEILKSGGFVSVFNFDQMKFEKFRKKLINLELLDPFQYVMSNYQVETILDIVCRAGYYDMFLLFKHNRQVNFDDLLLSACYGGNKTIVKELINMGASVNSTSLDTLFRSSPLIEACSRGHLPIVKLLIKNKADVNKKTDRYSPLSAACEGGHLRTAKFLIGKEADVNQITDYDSPLISACKGGNLDIVTLLIENEANVNQRTFLNSPLIAACEGGHLKIVTLLIEKEADVNQKTSAFSPLIAACESGNLKIVTFLIENQADVNQTTDRFSPLIAACESGNLKIVTSLIKNGANVNFKNSFNETPLGCATNPNVANLLKQNGAII